MRAAKTAHKMKSKPLSLAALVIRLRKSSKALSILSGIMMSKTPAKSLKTF